MPNYPLRFGNRWEDAVRRAFGIDSDAQELRFNQENLHLNDDIRLNFGTGDDRYLVFDGTNLDLIGGALRIATGGLTVIAGGLTVSAGGLTVTSGGLQSDSLTLTNGPLLEDQETVTTGSPTLQAFGATNIDSSGGAVTGTLPDPAGGLAAVGQEKIIVMTDASNSSTITITNHETEDAEVATFDAVDEYGLFKWTGTEWVTVSATCTFV